MKKLSLLVILALLLSSCTPVASRLLVKNCRFSLAEVVLEDAGLTSLTLRLGIEVENPNMIEVILDRLAFDFYINNSKVFKGVIKERTVIPPGEARIVHTTVKLSILRLGISIYRAIKREEAEYLLKGKAYFDTKYGLIAIPVSIERGRFSPE